MDEKDTGSDVLPIKDDRYSNGSAELESKKAKERQADEDLEKLKRTITVLTATLTQQKKENQILVTDMQSMTSVLGSYAFSLEKVNAEVKRLKQAQANTIQNLSQD